MLNKHGLKDIRISGYIFHIYIYIYIYIYICRNYGLINRASRNGPICTLTYVRTIQKLLISLIIPHKSIAIKDVYFSYSKSIIFFFYFNFFFFNTNSLFYSLLSLNIIYHFFFLFSCQPQNPIYPNINIKTEQEIFTLLNSEKFHITK
jgi:hypothetical protein